LKGQHSIKFTKKNLRTPDTTTKSRKNKKCKTRTTFLLIPLGSITKARYTMRSASAAHDVVHRQHMNNTTDRLIEALQHVLHPFIQKDEGGPTMSRRLQSDLSSPTSSTIVAPRHAKVNEYDTGHCPNVLPKKNHGP
jgi:hypothetical protein